MAKYILLKSIGIPLIEMHFNTQILYSNKVTRFKCWVIIDIHSPYTKYLDRVPIFMDKNIQIMIHTAEKLINLNLWNVNKEQDFYRKTDQVCSE